MIYINQIKLFNRITYQECYLWSRVNRYNIIKTLKHPSTLLKNNFLILNLNQIISDQSHVWLQHTIALVIASDAAGQSVAEGGRGCGPSWGLGSMRFVLKCLTIIKKDVTHIYKDAFEEVCASS